MAHMPVIAMLGGGQLGRMFLENALRYDVHVHVLDPDPDAPCARIAGRFVTGHFNDHDTVMAFAKDADVVGIEIEHVSLSALDALKAAGKRVIPDPDALRTINDKGLQKQFYKDHDIPTTDFRLIEDRDGLRQEDIVYPAFLKARTGGYDGKGVMALRSPNDIGKAFDGPYVVEAQAPIAKELAVIGVRDVHGRSALFPLVEMVFDPELNLVDHLIAPARLRPEEAEAALSTASKVMEALGSPGVFAVELFLLEDGRVLVNETAPRAHNSGHFSIEACPSSQFDQLLRIMMGWPLGATDMKGHAAMVNLVGEQGSGAVAVDGLDELLRLPDAFFHLYGKKETRSGRKMGHVTLLGAETAMLERAIAEVKQKVRIRPQRTTVQGTAG